MAASFTLNTITAIQIAPARSAEARRWITVTAYGPGEARVGIGFAPTGSTSGLPLAAGEVLNIVKGDHDNPQAEALHAIGVGGNCVVEVIEGGY